MLDRWLTPPVLLTALLILFSFAWRSERAGKRVVAGLLLLAGTAIALGSTIGSTLFSPATWPVAILIIASLVLIAGLEREIPAASENRTVTFAGFSLGEHLCALPVLVLLLLAIWLGEAPLGELADPSSPPAVVRMPWFLLGLEEIGHYFQPWATRWLSAALFLGLLVLPFLDREGPAPGDEEMLNGDPTLTSPSRHRAVAVILFIWLVLGLYPMAVGAWFCRGPEGGVAVLGMPWWGEGPGWPLSEKVWNRWLAIGAPERWWIRELPGLVVMALYFIWLPLQLPRWKSTRGVFARIYRQLGSARYWLMALLLLLMLLPALKMYARWLFDIGSLVELPELGLGL